MSSLLPALLAALNLFAVADTPEDVVRSFVTALNKKDFEAAAKLVRDGSVTPYLNSALGSTSDLPKMTLSKVVSAIVDNHAIVTFHLVTDAPPGIPPSDDYLVLVSTPSGWKIDQPVRGGGLSLMAHFLSDPPLLRQAHAAAQATHCLSNIKQITTAFHIFLADSDDVFKLNGTNWRTQLAPYAKSPGLFTCPLDAKGVSSYSFNQNLAKKDLMSIDEMTRTVMVYEGADGKLNFRHNGRAAVGLADGSARLVEGDVAKQLIWK